MPQQKTKGEAYSRLTQIFAAAQNCAQKSAAKDARAHLDPAEKCVDALPAGDARDRAYFNGLSETLAAYRQYTAACPKEDNPLVYIDQDIFSATVTAKRVAYKVKNPAARL